jgi:hypothetical protein
MNSKIRSLESRVLSPGSAHSGQSTVHGPQTKGAEARKGRQPNTGADDIEWWRGLPEGEKAVIRLVLWLLRSTRQSPVQEVARAATKWERGIGCFIKVRLKNQRRRTTDY